VFYVRSDDLGRTWTPPVILSHDYVDRPFVSVGSRGGVVVTWQKVSQPRGGRAAWSADGGSSWARTDAAMEGCQGFGRALDVEASFLFACIGHDAVHLARLDVTTSQLDALAATGGGFYLDGGRNGT